MTKRHLILRLDAPLMSFGGVAIDQLGVIDAWPHVSLLTGLIGNALGYRRTDPGALQALQDRLVFACRADREGERLRDFQTVALEPNEEGWTTRGQPEGRRDAKRADTRTHIRYRDYWADRIVTVAMRLEPTGAEPDLDRIAEALAAPVRPLFIGRKPCLPAAPLLAGEQEGDSGLDAVSSFPVLIGENAGRRREPADYLACAPAHDQPHAFVADRFREVRVSGRRDWTSDAHGGEQRWWEGRVAAPCTEVP